MTCLSYSALAFYMGIAIFGLVCARLVWNVTTLVSQSPHWLLGVVILGPGAGITAGYLVFYSSSHNIKDSFPKAFVFVTVVTVLYHAKQLFVYAELMDALYNRSPSLPPLMEPEYFEATTQATSNSASLKPVWTWYRNQTHEFYRYVRDDNTGMVQKFYDKPYVQNNNDRNMGSNPKKGILNHTAETATPYPSRKATPVSFEPLETPPKYFMEGKALPIIDSAIYGPTKLQTSNFNSKDSQGITAWHYSQSPMDLSSPLPETPIPSKLGTIYIHRNTRDGGYQIWVWLSQGDQERWQPVDLSGPLLGASQYTNHYSRATIEEEEITITLTLINA
ncbi:hypothetical protein EV360DRAFT_66948 [Lentinula raphanica]|nr:hypothetical protein EV360DRAFT_66948 [Lentinula raphanica]